MQEESTLHFPCPGDPCDAAAAVPTSVLNSCGTQNSSRGVDPLWMLSWKPWWKPFETGKVEDGGHKQRHWRAAPGLS